MALSFQRVSKGVAVFLYFSGNLMMIYGFRIQYKKGERLWVTPPSADEPITTDVYAISRNPMYFGFLTQLLGVTTLAYRLYPIHEMKRFHYVPIIGIMSFVSFAALFEIIIVPREEASCHEKWGKMYQMYSNDVNRWITWKRLFSSDLSQYEMDFTGVPRPIIESVADKKKKSRAKAILALAKNTDNTKPQTINN